jgi:hypothetical protein
MKGEPPQMPDAQNSRGVHQQVTANVRTAALVPRLCADRVMRYRLLFPCRRSLVSRTP